MPTQESTCDPHDIDWHTEAHGAHSIRSPATELLSRGIASTSPACTVPGRPQKRKNLLKIFSLPHIDHWAISLVLLRSLSHTHPFRLLFRSFFLATCIGSCELAFELWCCWPARFLYFLSFFSRKTEWVCGCRSYAALDSTHWIVRVLAASALEVRSRSVRSEKSLSGWMIVDRNQSYKIGLNRVYRWGVQLIGFS